jgi:hypothetical protein
VCVAATHDLIKLLAKLVIPPGCDGWACQAREAVGIAAPGLPPVRSLRALHFSFAAEGRGDSESCLGFRQVSGIQAVISGRSEPTRSRVHR